MQKILMIISCSRETGYIYRRVSLLMQHDALLKCSVKYTTVLFKLLNVDIEPTDTHRFELIFDDDFARADFPCDF